MSSGRPNGSASPSAWRSISTSKKAAASSVSLVFAEPEPGAPLQSAAAKLPPAAYTNSRMLRKRDRFDSASTLRDDQKDAMSLSGGSIKRPRAESDISQTTASTDVVRSCQVPSGQSTAPSVSDGNYTSRCDGLMDRTSQASMPPDTVSDVTHRVPMDTLSVPFPSKGSTKSNLTPKSSPSGSSWFGSLSRSKGKDKAAELSDETNCIVPSDVKAAPSDATSSQPSGHDILHATARQSEPLPINPLNNSAQQTSNRQTNFGWFSGSPTKSSSIARPPLSPTSLHSHTHTDSRSSIPSVDEEVPKLAVITPLNTPLPPTIVQNGVGSNLNLSSLNPSTSRFMLSIPLLGRPKIPLDKVAAVAIAGDDRPGDKGATDRIVQTFGM